MPIADGPRLPAGYSNQASALYGSTYTDLLELVPDLQWPQSVTTYNSMRRDPQMAAVLNAYTLPLRSGTWMIDPAGARDEIVQYAADMWGLPILGDTDVRVSPYRRRGVQFKQHLRLAMLSLVFGHMPFAFAGEVIDGRWRMTRLDERLPSTISDINVDEQGDLVSIRQYGEQFEIPARNLLWYTHDREGSNWAGTSMLRPTYGSWLLKHEMWRVLGTSSRRFGMGVPFVQAPPGATGAEVENAGRLAAAMRVGDQSGMGLPAGFTAGLMAVTGTLPDTLGFVRYLDQQIAQAALASILTLDATPNGSRALGDVIVGLLRMSWEAVAEEISIPATELTARAIDFNWLGEEAVPQIICTDLDHQERTYEALAALAAVGVLTPDPTLEAAVRESYQLPSINPGYVPASAADQAKQAADLQESIAAAQPATDPAPVTEKAPAENAGASV